MNPAAIAKAVKRLAVIRFFPADADARLEIMEQIRRILGDGELYRTTPEERLAWLIDTAVTHMREWGGLPELRGLYCTRWKPADGVEMYCSIPGFTPADSEMAWIREGQAFKGLLESGARPKLLDAPESDRMPDDELKQFHQDTMGKLVESTTLPGLRPRAKQALAAAEREVQEAASRPTLTEAEKARRLQELQASLGMDSR